MKTKKKLRHQVKSRFYYLFWGAATISVFAGQFYVGTGYRRMSDSIDNLLRKDIIIEVDPRHRIPDIYPDYRQNQAWHLKTGPMRLKSSDKTSLGYY